MTIVRIADEMPLICDGVIVRLLAHPHDDGRHYGSCRSITGLYRPPANSDFFVNKGNLGAYTWWGIYHRGVLSTPDASLCGCPPGGGPCRI